MTATKRVFFVNGDGSGFAEWIEVPSDYTVQDLFKKKMGSANPNNYLIRLKRDGTALEVAANELLRDGDRLSCLPSKISGA